jgi:hypothetical protein
MAEPTTHGPDDPVKLAKGFFCYCCEADHAVGETVKTACVLDRWERDEELIMEGMAPMCPLCRRSTPVLDGVYLTHADEMRQGECPNSGQPVKAIR